MKLWLRIFLSILLVSMTFLLVSTITLTNKNHFSNIEREQSRSVNEFDYIKTSILNSVNFKTSDVETYKSLIMQYGVFYAKRGIYLAIFQEGSYILNNIKIPERKSYKDLLFVDPNIKLARIMENEGNHYFLVSGILAEEGNVILIYSREINSIYDARKTSIRLTIIISAALIIILGSLSYLYSRWITKPIKTLHKGAVAMSDGNYNIRIPNMKDEFKDLANSFNNMAVAVEGRTLELEEKAKELQVFIDDLSHELNTPLTSIQGYAEFLQNANASEEQQIKAAGNIRTQAERMKDIHTKLMTLTLTRESKPEFADVDTHSLFNDIKDTFLLQLSEHNISLKSEVSIPSVYADRTMLQILLGNLIKNSLQAVDKGGEITMKAYEEGGKPILEISDNGIGIPQDKIKDVVKPFFRVDKSRSRKTGGAGLGLSICKNIVNLHNAELIIESNPGEGTKIKVIFL